jgi:hypothetical protein
MKRPLNDSANLLHRPVESAGNQIIKLDCQAPMAAFVQAIAMFDGRLRAADRQIVS